jgi:NAD(P)-dependent dehydrogenase (short-subunit alcohol dehydrogenase family)
MSQKNKRVLLVTGGARGIGAAIVRLAANEGYAVAINYQQAASEANALAKSIHDQGGLALAIQGDVSKEDDVVNMFKQIDEHLGVITALVNNAGIVDQKARVSEMHLDRLQKMFATNVFGSFMCAREAVLRMSTQLGGQGGVIVNISSIASRLGSPSQYVDYAASKAAIDTLTTGLAKEVASEGIRVNAVSPGIIDTDIHASGGEPDRVKQVSGMIPIGRAGTAEEVANAVLWVLSDQASYVTGACIDVSGGR